MGLYTRAECKAIAEKFRTRMDWQFGHNSSYQYAYKRGWLKFCTVNIPTNRNTYTLKQCKTISKKFKTRMAWARAHHKSYSYASRHKWMDKCCAHMFVYITTKDNKKIKVKPTSKNN